MHRTSIIYIPASDAVVSPPPPPEGDIEFYIGQLYQNIEGVISYTGGSNNINENNQISNRVVVPERTEYTVTINELPPDIISGGETTTISCTIFSPFPPFEIIGAGTQECTTESSLRTFIGIRVIQRNVSFSIISSQDVTGVVPVIANVTVNINTRFIEILALFSDSSLGGGGCTECM